MTNPATLSCFVGFALLACAGTSPRQPIGPSPAARAAAPRATPSAAVAVAPGTVRGDANFTGLELLSLLRGSCQLAPLRNAPSGPAAGCTCCAPFDACRPQSSSSSKDLLSSTPSDDVFQPSLALAGSYTRAGRDEWALTMQGCEPHVENFGGMLLLARGNDGYELKRYVSGLNADACWAIRRDDARDLLVCRRGDVHQGVAEEMLFQWDLAEADDALLRTAPLADVSDDEMEGCWSEAGTPVSSTHLGEPRFGEEAGRPLLTLVLDAREGVVSAEYLERCRELEHAPEGSPMEASRYPRTLLPRAVDYLRFRFDGSRFVAARGGQGY
jgi:hypothetical protein